MLNSRKIKEEPVFMRILLAEDEKDLVNALCTILKHSNVILTLYNKFTFICSFTNNYYNIQFKGDIQMEELLEILNEIDDTIDYENETALIDDHILDSFGVITLVSEIEEAFDIRVAAKEMVPANFNSAKAIWAMIERLQEN